MKVSIITVCFNSARTVENTLQSIQMQDYSDIEHIVIDGGSADGTLNILARYRDQIDHLVSEPDGGVYDAMNKGIALSTGETVGFLNSDDVYSDQSAVARLAAPFADSAVDACYGDLVYVDRHDLNRIVRYWRSSPPRESLCAACAVAWVPAHPTFWVRRRIYRELGGFDLKFSIAADVELMMRLLCRHSIRAVYLPEVLVKMRVGGITNRSVRGIVDQNIEILRAARKNGIPLPVWRILFKFGGRLWQFIGRP